MTRFFQQHPGRLLSMGKRVCAYTGTVLLFFLIVTLSSKAGHDAGALINQMIHTFESLESYTATLSTESDGDKQVLRYYYKKPGYIKMIFINPHKGAWLAYNPETGKAILRPYEKLGFFSLTLAPDNPLILSPLGHTIDKSSINHLLIQMQTLYRNGFGTVKPGSPTDKTIALEITGKDGFSVINTIHKYDIICTSNPVFPQTVKAYTADGTLVEQMMISDLKINPVFSDDIFDF